MIATRFTERVGCRAPLQLASLPSVGGCELVAAVANAGGLGMLGAALLSPGDLAAELDDLHARLEPGAAVGVNFLAPFFDPACLPIAAARARVVEFFYGEPRADWVALAHEWGALVSWQVGSREEALAAERVGCDLIVAQGTQAGGHVRGALGRREVLAQVVDAVRVPVLSAGGIAGPRDVADALAAGAAGVRVGTRFLGAREAHLHPAYLEAVLAARGEDTVLTEAFGVGWPDAPHRVLRSCVAAAEALPSQIAGETWFGSQKLVIPRFGVVPPSDTTTGEVRAMALYCGEGVGAVTRTAPAAEIVEELLDGVETRLQARARD